MKNKIKLDYKIGSNKLFYDVIYNPKQNKFSFKKGEKSGNKIENGKMMFIYQAQLAFKIWHNILPKVDNEKKYKLMIRIAVLGDIGSGKSHVAKQFGYPVFNADNEVAKLYKKIKNVIIN